MQPTPSLNTESPRDGRPSQARALTSLHQVIVRFIFYEEGIAMSLLPSFGNHGVHCNLPQQEGTICMYGGGLLRHKMEKVMMSQLFMFGTPQHKAHGM